jgi:hypothetical protein
MGQLFSKKKLDLNKNYNKEREKFEKVIEKNKKNILINNLIREIVLLSDDTKFNNYLLKQLKISNAKTT